MRALTLILALLLVATTSNAVAASWETISKRLSAAVVRVTIHITGQDGTGTCTAFSINEARNYYLTAAHCAAGDAMTLDSHIAWPIYVNHDLDLMVMQAPGVQRPALQVSRRLVSQGTQIAAFGYAGGMPQPSFRLGVVQVANVQRDIWVGDLFTGRLVTGQRWHISDYAYIGGMSGGPVVDRDGKVVSIVQLGDQLTGLGRPLDVILDATGQFWEN